MKSTYYSAAWTDSGCLLSCGHEHETLVEAASCIPCAGGYVVGIENGVMRSLRTEEESEVQSVIHSRKKPAPYTTAPAAASAEQGSRDPGYAVMTRIRVVDYWTWATWMCFDTYAQAVAHSRKGDKVVRFSSDEWAALKQQKCAEQPQQTDTAPPIHMNSARESLPARGEGETLVEFVLRLLSAHGLDQHAEPISDVKHGSVVPAGPIPIKGQKDGSLTSESDKQTSMIETPASMARLILSRLSESEIAKLTRMRENDIPALLNALRDRSQTVANNKSRCQ
jgi:hypothetical protein